MTTQVQCCVPECAQPRIARGYCRRHYGQMWRHGEIRKQEPKRAMSQTAQQLLRCSLQLQIAEAQRNYELVVGLAGRVSWRQRINELQQQLAEVSQDSSSGTTSEA